VIDERALQDLRASFEADWLKHATDAELALLQLSAERPELFEVPDDGSIHVLLDPSIGDELVVTSPTATVSPNAAALVFHRTRLRARHGLPQADCAQPPALWTRNLHLLDPRAGLARRCRSSRARGSSQGGAEVAQAKRPASARTQEEPKGGSPGARVPSRAPA
jgi:hypothetical protein